MTKIDIGSGLRGALAAWGAMTGMMALARRAGLTPMSITEIEGAFFAKPHTTEAKTIGFATHLGMSLGIGFAYALGFKLLGLRVNWRSGLLGGALHWLIAAVVVGVVSEKHPKRDRLALPGFAGLALGPPTAVGFLAGHLLFGAVFGWQYGRGEEG